MITLLANSLSVLIGFIILLSGILKAVNAKLFLDQLSNLKFIPESLASFITILVIELECALGMALIIRIFPENVIPSTLFILLSGFGVTVIGKLNKNIHTCGCYGHAMWIPLPISLLLNIVYMATLSWIWLIGIKTRNDYHLWQVFLILISIASSGFLIKQSLVRPIWDITITRPGRKFKIDWFGDLFSDPDPEQYLLVFLNKHCAVCKEWVIQLNYLSEKQQQIKIIAVLNSDLKTAKKGFQESVLFDQRYLPPSRFYFMAQQFPTALLIVNGIIEKKWLIQFPTELLD
ncbi:MAG: hypothetical protein HOD92_04955 [Deltaproteobacteria bacterium]|jgi:hypothetical protein|nr:hypothetical protein [Deltaproteobacteria bacterium]MBT4527705.1 hypothetical protein [Deltaproteobacteria bacterium]